MKGAYDGFDALAEVKAFYKRCRRLKHFILSPAGVLKDNPVCSVCGNLLTEGPVDEPNPPEGYRSNICCYHPKLKKIACMHYLCAWSSLLNRVFAMGDRLR
jgi:hypothetical protein